MEQTLLLNATYEPLKVVHWQKAITLWCQGKVEIVDVYDSVTVTGVPVQCDLRGQLVGRLARFTRSGEDRPGEPS